MHTRIIMTAFRSHRYTGEFADFIVPDEEDGEEEEDDEWIQGDQHGSWIPRAARDGPPPELPALRGRPRRSCRNAE